MHIVTSEWKVRLSFLAVICQAMKSCQNIYSWALGDERENNEKINWLCLENVFYLGRPKALNCLWRSTSVHMSIIHRANWHLSHSYILHVTRKWTDCRQNIWGTPEGNRPVLVIFFARCSNSTIISWQHVLSEYWSMPLEKTQKYK